MKQKMTTTERILTKMFTENTGRAMCDSGDYYGRNWERNQGRKFLQEDSRSVKFGSWQYGDEKPCLEIDYTINAFHFCNDNLYFEKNMDRSFQRFANKPENEDTGWLALIEEWIEKRFKGEARGIYGEGEPLSINTYNEDSNLSQVLQFHYFTYEGEEYYVLQVHGGCDVRGGYSTPRVFSGGSHSELGLFDHNKGEIGCSDCDTYWYYSGSWGENGSWGMSYVDLEDNELVAVETEEEWANRPTLVEGQMELLAGCAPDRVGVITVFEDKASCPVCGKGVLR